MTYFLPKALPKKQSSIFSDFSLSCFKAAPSLNDQLISSLLASKTSINSLSHAIARQTPVFTQKNLVAFIIARQKVYQGKPATNIHIHFNYDTLFYGHLSRQHFFGVFYDRATQSIAIDTNAKDALAWVKNNIQDYFQVIINLTSHKYLYSESRPKLRGEFTPAFHQITPVSVWVSMLKEIVHGLDSAFSEVSKIEIHDGDSFVAMPTNFMILCRMDTLIIKVFDKKNWYRYFKIDLKKHSNSSIYRGVKNTEITKAISQYMDACNYHQTKPFMLANEKK